MDNPANKPQNLASHYDQQAGRRDYYLRRNRYYYNLLYKQYRHFVPEGKRVLEVGCSTGELLNALNPSYGLGVDLSLQMIDRARHKFPHLDFRQGSVGDLEPIRPFDYIVLSGVLGETEDILQLLSQLNRFCHPRTRVIVEYYSCLWQYILKPAEFFGWKIPQKTQNWLTHHDIVTFLNLAGFRSIRRERTTLLPVWIPVISWLVNKFIAKLPVLNPLTLNHFVIARPVPASRQDYSVSILVPARNERDNIEDAVRRLPEFGLRQEILFVEGGSKDGTYEEIERVMQAYPGKDISLHKQQGRGKGDAIRLGFSKAKHDVLMILDADLTVPPEELPKFYEALSQGKGEFINGCRLVYPMEKQAMRFLNLVANKFFSMFFTWLLGQSLKDTLCGTKVLLREDYEEISRNRSYFGDFDPFGDFDLIFGAAKLNMQITDLPVHYHARQYGETQIQRFRHGLLLFRMCFVAMRKIKFI